MPPVTSATRFVVVIGLLLLFGSPLSGYVIGPLSLDRQRHAHAAADAQTREPLVGVSADHLVQQRDEYAAAGCANRMPDGDRAAIDVDLRGVPAHLAIDADGLRGERLVDLHQIELLVCPARLAQA